MYKYYRIVGLAVFMLFLGAPCIYASGTAEDDKCIIHLDKAFYINGEVIWYKVYLPNVVKDRPVALKIVLTNPAGKALNSSFIKTEGKTYAHGYFKIPFDISPGMYHLFVVGMNEVLLSPVTLAEILIPIYNDEQIPPSTNLVENTSAIQNYIPEGLRVAVGLETENVHNREEVQVRIKVTNASGQPAQANLSVSVTDWALSGSETINRPTLRAGATSYPGTFTSLKGSLYTRTRLVNNANEPLQANVLGVFSPTENKMYYTKSNAEGVIFLEMADFYDVKPIQFIGYDNEYEYISIAEIKETTIGKEEPLVYTPGILEYLTHSRQRKKIFQMYSSLEFSLDPEIPKQEAQVLDENLKLQVEKYEKFGNLSDFFREVLTPLRFREVTDSSFSAKMYNPLNKRINNYFPGNPLFIIDGKVTRNGNYTANLAQDKIQRIGIIYDPPKLRGYFNVFGNNGVVIITTSLPEVNLPAEDEEDIMVISGLQSITNFPSFEPKEGNKHRPFFRPQLYWNPTLQTDENGEITFSYFQSDDKSMFRIEVVAQDIGSTIGSGQLIYEVK